MSINLKNISIDQEITSADIAEISQDNQVKGIHRIVDENGEIESVAILCTINGESYQNEWIEYDNVLKYYLYGTTVNGKKKFSTDYKSNQAVINSKDKYPIHTFVRNKKTEKFRYKGEYNFYDVSSDLDGAMYFILEKSNSKNTNIKISEISAQDIENFPEGKVKERLHKYKERNPKVIKEAKDKFKKEHGKLYCQVCGFDFEEVYGEIGQDYIEGHHTKPVSELKEDDATNVNDILLVCSNCHRMLHRKRPCLTKEELIDLYNKAKV